MKPKISVSIHTWLDLSMSYFVKVNGVKSGGEIDNKEDAIETAKSLAEQINGEYIGENETNELFS